MHFQAAIRVDRILTPDVLFLTTFRRRRRLQELTCHQRRTKVGAVFPWRPKSCRAEHDASYHEEAQPHIEAVVKLPLVECIEHG